MRLRVVWGFGLMMARRSPTSAFSSVDLPAFGRPKIQTKPEWKGMDLIYVSQKCINHRGHRVARRRFGIQDMTSENPYEAQNRRHYISFIWRGSMAAMR